MATLDSDFEDGLRQAVLDDVEQTLQEEIGPQFIAIARQNWQAYASRNGYDIDFIWEAAELAVERTDDGVTLRVEWPELSALFEFGVSPHTIEGNPTLTFYWEAKDRWITTDEVNWGSETGGINESRAVRDAMNDLRRVLQG